MTRAHARKGRHHHHLPAVRHPGGQRLDLGRRADDAQAVAQPLDQGAGGEDAAFEQVIGLPVATPGHRTEQPVPGGHGRTTGIDRQETSGAVGVLGHARLEAGLAERRRLLITRDARNRDRLAQQGGVGLADHGRRIDHLGQDGRRNIEERE